MKIFVECFLLFYYRVLVIESLNFRYLVKIFFLVGNCYCMQDYIVEKGFVLVVEIKENVQICFIVERKEFMERRLLKIEKEGIR